MRSEEKEEDDDNVYYFGRSDNLVNTTKGLISLQDNFPMKASLYLKC